MTFSKEQATQLLNGLRDQTSMFDFPCMITLTTPNQSLVSINTPLAEAATETKDRMNAMAGKVVARALLDHVNV